MFIYLAFLASATLPCATSYYSKSLEVVGDQSRCTFWFDGVPTVYYKHIGSSWQLQGFVCPEDVRVPYPMSVYDDPIPGPFPLNHCNRMFGCTAKLVLSDSKVATIEKLRDNLCSSAERAVPMESCKVGAGFVNEMVMQVSADGEFWRPTGLTCLDKSYPVSSSTRKDAVSTNGINLSCAKLQQGVEATVAVVMSIFKRRWCGFYEASFNNAEFEPDF